VVLQAAWEQAVVQDILGGMAALRFFCRDLEQAQQQGLAHLHSLHQAHAQVPFLPSDITKELSAVTEASMHLVKLLGSSQSTKGVHLQTCMK